MDGWMDGSSLIQKWSLKKKLMGISKIKPDSKFSPQSRTGDSLIQKCSLKVGPAGTSKNKCPTNIASKVSAWDGWMDGWMDDSASFIFLGKSLWAIAGVLYPSQASFLLYLWLCLAHLQSIISITSFFPACFVLTLIGSFSCCSAAAITASIWNFLLLIKLDQILLVVTCHLQQRLNYMMLSK